MPSSLSKSNILRLWKNWHKVEKKIKEEMNWLGVYKEGKANLFIEVGTTSFYKLWINLEQMKKMKNFVYLIVLNDDKMIEFRGNKNEGSPLF